MRVALFRTPVANVRAQFASLLDERTVAGDRIDAQPADRRALDAAGRTVIFTFLTDHLRETVAALGRAVVAGGDAVLGALVKMMIHVAFPFVEIGPYWRARNACAVKLLVCASYSLLLQRQNQTSQPNLGESPSRAGGLPH